MLPGHKSLNVCFDLVFFVLILSAAMIREEIHNFRGEKIQSEKFEALENFVFFIRRRRKFEKKHFRCEMFCCSKKKRKKSLTKSVEENSDRIDEFHRFLLKQSQTTFLVFFHAEFCPFSRQIRPELRRWIDSTDDRIFFHEIDVQKEKVIAEFYQIRSIPILLAFHRDQIDFPFWKRISNEILSNETRNFIISSKKTNFVSVKLKRSIRNIRYETVLVYFRVSESRTGIFKLIFSLKSMIKSSKLSSEI